MAAARPLSCLVVSVLLALAPPVSASVVKEASTRLSDDDLAAASAQLEAAMDRAAHADFDDAASRRQRAELMGRARDLREEAAVTLRQGPSLAALIEGIGGVRDGLLALADESVARAGAGGGSAASGEAAPGGAIRDPEGRDPYMTTTFIAFRDVSEDALSVLGRLTAAEQADVRQLIQAGDDLVAIVREINRTDHVARAENLRSLQDVTAKLKALHQTGLLDRTKGRPFVPAWRSPSGWLQVGQEQGGLEALRASFEKPGSAWVVLRNATDAPKPWFVEIEFFDGVGETTGTATAESNARRPLAPGEVRRVVVPITPSQPRFWDVTRGWTIYVE